MKTNWKTEFLIPLPDPIEQPEVTSIEINGMVVWTKEEGFVAENCREARRQPANPDIPNRT